MNFAGLDAKTNRLMRRSHDEPGVSVGSIVFGRYRTGNFTITSYSLITLFRYQEPEQEAPIVAIVFAKQNKDMHGQHSGVTAYRHLHCHN